MRAFSLFLLSLFWSLVHCQQTFPYVSFMGETLANHSYVDIYLVGTDWTDAGNTIQCHTELNSCCTSYWGPHRGNWFFPNGDQIPLYGHISSSRRGQRVDLRRLQSSGVLRPSGIYCCSISTVAVHHPSNVSVGDTVYVGL